MKRSPIRRKARPASDRVSPGLHLYILERDKVCILSRFDPAHRCAGQFGDRHEPDDLSQLTVDHVWRHSEGAHAGKRAPSDRGHLVAICWQGNVKPPSHLERDFERDHLDLVEPE